MPRKKPFSSKQKKKQLQDKRVRKQNKHGGASTHHVSSKEASGESADDDEGQQANVLKVNEQPSTGQTYNPNRYRLHFVKESKNELQKRKEEAMQPFHPLAPSACEMSFEDIYRPGSVLDMPKRPPWNYSLSKHKLELNEHTYFNEYVEKIFVEHKAKELSYFELNLETWRQLWRVLEMSDVILLITDIRFPVLHFSPALYNYVTKDLNKSLIIVLNKIDLAPPGVVVAWKHYLRKHYPEVHVICFTSQPKREEERTRTGVLHKRKKVKRPRAVGPDALLKACENIAGEAVDLSSWREKLLHEQVYGYDVSDDESEDESSAANITTLPPDLDTSFEHHERFKNGILTIGCIGYPNVGKSSLINGLNVKKVVSVSKTPGHTKHFQTIFLTPNVRLCDCPGLVFPSLVSKPLQVLAGMYPISQVREPYSVVQYLAERLDLPRILHLRHMDEDCNTWSAFDICDSWADKRGYMTARAARHDTYRAANSLLRYALDGTLCLCMKPPGYNSSNDDWENHSETREISEIQTQHCQAASPQSDEETLSQSSLDDGGDESGDDDIGHDGTTNYENPFALLADDD